MKRLKSESSGDQQKINEKSVKKKINPPQKKDFKKKDFKKKEFKKKRI